MMYYSPTAEDIDLDVMKKIPLPQTPLAQKQGTLRKQAIKHLEERCDPLLFCMLICAMNPVVQPSCLFPFCVAPYRRERLAETVRLVFEWMRSLDINNDGSIAPEELASVDVPLPEGVDLALLGVDSKDQLLEQCKGALGEISVFDVARFLQVHGEDEMTRLVGVPRQEVGGFSGFMQTLVNTMNVHTDEAHAKNKHLDRSVILNCEYIGMLQFRMDQGDKAFLMEKGKATMSRWLEQKRIEANRMATVQLMQSRFAERQKKQAVKTRYSWKVGKTGKQLDIEFVNGKLSRIGVSLSVDQYEIHDNAAQSGKQAFIASGGKAEDWSEHHLNFVHGVSLSVDQYEIHDHAAQSGKQAFLASGGNAAQSRKQSFIASSGKAEDWSEHHFNLVHRTGTAAESAAKGLAHGAHLLGSYAHLPGSYANLPGAASGLSELSHGLTYGANVLGSYAHLPRVSGQEESESKTSPVSPKQGKSRLSGRRPSLSLSLPGGASITTPDSPQTKSSKAYTVVTGLVGRGPNSLWT